MQLKIMYRIALAGDQKFIQDLGAKMPSKYTENFPLASFGVVAVVKEENTYKNIGAAWAVQLAEVPDAFIMMKKDYASETLHDTLKEQLVEKAKDRQVATINFH